MVTWIRSVSSSGKKPLGITTNKTMVAMKIPSDTSIVKLRRRMTIFNEPS